MLFDQFFSRFTGRAILGFCVAMGLALLAWAVPAVSFVCLVIVGLTVIALTRRSLEYGLLIAFFELIIGGHGALFSTELFGFSLSLRMVIFGAVMIVFLYGWWRGEYQPKFFFSRDSGFIILAVAVVIGTIIGFIRNDLLFAFDDANSYSVLLYALPFSALRVTQQIKRRFIQVLVLGVVLLSLSSVVLSYAFTHLDGDLLNIVYRFLRDTRLYEITLQLIHEPPAGRFESFLARFFETNTYWYRIFGPSQFYTGVVLLLLLSMGAFAYIKQKLPPFFYSLLGLIAFCFFLGMSRSFFIGFGFSAGLLLFGALLSKRRATIVARSLLFAGTAFFAVIAIVLTVKLPIPPNPPIEEAAFYASSKDTVRSMAVASRWQMLPPILTELKKSALIGAGFGKTITYVSSDPRVIAETGGVYTTYRFEWGYLDLLLKMGVIGILGFAVYAWFYLRASMYTAKKHGYDWLAYGLLASVVGLYALNIFTPYLNHPIGLFFLLVAVQFLDYEGYESTRDFKFPSYAPKILARGHLLLTRGLKRENL